MKSLARIQFLSGLWARSFCGERALGSVPLSVSPTVVRNTYTGFLTDTLPAPPIRQPRII